MAFDTKLDEWRRDGVVGFPGGLKMRAVWSAVSVLIAASSVTAVWAQDAVFSGPQVGEKSPAFKAVGIWGPQAGKEHQVNPTSGAHAVIFVHQIERSIVPLLGVIDQYCGEKKTQITGQVVFLSDDRVAAEQRLPLTSRAIRLQAPAALSLDGIEGPGAYGLNKKCMMTIVLSRDNKVAANFALTQPGIVDAPKVISAIAALIGDPKPPTAEELQTRRAALIGRDAPRRPNADPNAPKRQLPGAAPTDEKLIGMLRRFIQPTNTDADVDTVLKDVEAYVATVPDLRKQAINGWIRVLAIPYGTPYAQKVGKTFVEKLQKTQ